MRASLYYETIRYLKPLQIWSRLKRKCFNPRPDLSPPPTIRNITQTFVVPIGREASLVGPARFRFLKEERSCESPEDWLPRDAAKLWVYHLHYFDDLNAYDANLRADWHNALLHRWVEENPVGAGDGWEPYPVSLRIVNWVKWALCGGRLPDDCVASLAVQARWLLKRLEFHILGNHLLANAKALIFCGLFFDGDEADNWFEVGSGILLKEIEEQVLQDGGHFELSPMYHAIVFEDLLDTANVLRAYGRPVPGSLLEVFERMHRWLSLMSHPDGGIAFFNDAALDCAPSLEDLEEYLERLGYPQSVGSEKKCEVLAATGYVRAREGPATLLCDCGAVGPDYQPGHAHADTLSFELSLAEHRIVVNSGTSEYGSSAERLRQRGTAAHNSVQINNEDSSEVWGGFRVARRALTSLHKAESIGTATVVEASHFGYQRLPGRNTHRRKWCLNDKGLQIHDSVSGSASEISAKFHFFPGLTVQQATEAQLDFFLDNISGQITFLGAESVTLECGTWHPRFGEVIPNLNAVVRFSGYSLTTEISWQVQACAF